MYEEKLYDVGGGLKAYGLGSSTLTLTIRFLRPRESGRCRKCSHRGSNERVNVRIRAHRTVGSEAVVVWKRPHRLLR